LEEDEEFKIAVTGAIGRQNTGGAEEAPRRLREMG